MSVLKSYIKLIIERKLREVDLSDGSKVSHGHSKHIKDLELRIIELVKWRDRQHRGSEARANYARLIQRLRGELTSSRHAAAKTKGGK